jgi:hypothetical protein
VFEDEDVEDNSVGAALEGEDVDVKAASDGGPPVGIDVDAVCDGVADAGAGSPVVVDILEYLVGENDVDQVN